LKQFYILKHIVDVSSRNFVLVAFEVVAMSCETPVEFHLQGK